MSAGLASAERKRPVRDLVTYMRDPAGFLVEIGLGEDLVIFRIGPRKFALINRPELIELVLTREDGIERDRFLKPVRRRFLGPSLITRAGPAHGERQALLEPIYSPEAVEAYGQRVVDLSADLGQRWSPGQALDILEEMRRLSLAMVGAVLFGPGSMSEQEALAEAQARTQAVFHRFMIPALDVLWSIPVPATLRFRRARERVEGLLAEQIRARREGSATDDLLTAMAVTPDGGPRLDDEAVRDEVLTFAFGALDQIALAVTWTLLELARHPDIEQRLHEELDGALDGRPPATADLQGLPYLRQVLAEALRLHPVAWVLTREVVEPLSLDGAELQPGTTIMISPYVTQRDPRYFAEPLHFDPDRWAERISADRPFEAEITFGGGDYRCLGRHLARIECMLIIATLASNWRFLAASDLQVAEKAGIALEPKPPPIMELARRSAHG